MEKKNNNKIVLGVMGFIVLLASFYGGMTYGGNNVRASMTARSFQNGEGMRGNRNNGGFTSGEIISKDATSITIKLQTSGSKIIFLDTNTKVAKSASGTVADLTTGAQVSITGIANTDGSINAQTIQIRPSMPQSAKVQ